MSDFSVWRHIWSKCSGKNSSDCDYPTVCIYNIHIYLINKKIFSHLVTMGSAAWLGPHRPNKPLPFKPVRPQGFLKCTQWWNIRMIKTKRTRRWGKDRIVITNQRTGGQSNPHKWLASQIWSVEELETLPADTMRGHHTIDRPEDRGVEKGSARWSSLKGQERATVNQTNTGTVS